MVVISLEAVQSAKASLRRDLGQPAWLRGIGIGFSDDGSYCLKVNVAEMTPEVRAALPTRVVDVRISVEAVGDIQTLPAAR